MIPKYRGFDADVAWFCAWDWLVSGQIHQSCGDLEGDSFQDLEIATRMIHYENEGWLDESDNLNYPKKNLTWPMNMNKHGGFLKWGYPHSWMVYNGKSELTMNNWMIWGYHHFRKPPHRMKLPSAQSRHLNLRTEGIEELPESPVTMQEFLWISGVEKLFSAHFHDKIGLHQWQVSRLWLDPPKK